MVAMLMSVLLLAAGDPAPAASPPAAKAAAPARPKAKAPAMTCWDERPTGSHVPQRICATREELDKAQRDGQDAVTGLDHRPKPPMSPS